MLITYYNMLINQTVFNSVDNFLSFVIKSSFMLIKNNKIIAAITAFFYLSTYQQH